MRDTAGMMIHHRTTAHNFAFSPKKPLGVFIILRVLRWCLADFFCHPRIFPFTPCFGHSKHFNDMLPLIPHIEGVAKAPPYLQVQRRERCGGRVSRALLVVGLPSTVVEVYL